MANQIKIQIPEKYVTVFAKMKRSVMEPHIWNLWLAMALPKKSFSQVFSQIYRKVVDGFS